MSIKALSPRESEVLSLMAQGLGNAAIAKRMFLEPRTIERHINAIYFNLEPPHGYYKRVYAILEWLRFKEADDADN